MHVGRNLFGDCADRSTILKKNIVGRFGRQIKLKIFYGIRSALIWDMTMSPYLYLWQLENQFKFLINRVNKGAKFKKQT